jgi:hypothetical protein
MFDPVFCIIALVAAQFVALVFFFAGVGKLLSGTSATKQAVEAYRLLPSPVARFLGFALPWVELLIAASLLSGILAGLAAMVGLALLALFSLAQATVLLRGQQVPCGCFGSLSTRPVQWTNIASNLGLIACCLISLVALPEVFDVRWLGQAFPGDHGRFLSGTEVVALQLLVAAVFVESMILKQILENRDYQLAYEKYQRELSAALAIQHAGAKVHQ